LRFAENVSADPPTVEYPKVAGPAVTTTVAADVAGEEEPPPFEAVTATRSVPDASALCTV
jgi:hypothetical protein